MMQTEKTDQNSKKKPLLEKGRIAVIDDDADLQDLIADLLSRDGYAVQQFISAEAAIGSNALQSIDLILCDLRMPGMSGLEFLKKFKSLHPEIPVLLATAFGSVDGAIDAVKSGADDYIQKPFTPNDLRTRIERTLKYRQLEKHNAALRSEILQTTSSASSFEGMIGRNSGMKRVFELIDRVSKTDASVLITGESGTGKEVVAKAIHNRSPRRDKPIIAINCAAIPEALLESELFGHAKGAFTGAVLGKKGLFEEADGGTVFLDEIGEMPAHLQAKLLRVLQERKVRPVGSSVLKEVDIRIIAATHRDLAHEIHSGRFREDLYYRLNVIPIAIPPLRKRKDDLLLLADYFLKKASARYNSQVTGFSPAALNRILSHGWPGNVRELENAVERAVVLCTDSKIEENQIELPTVYPEEPEEKEESKRPRKEESARVDAPNSATSMSLPMSLHEVEKAHIIKVLELNQGHRELAAKMLEIDRKTLYRKILQFGLKK